MEQFTCKYAELASVSIQQPYYTNGICKKYQVNPVPDFELVPTNDCQTIMKRLDVLFRIDARSGGFIVLARIQVDTGSDAVLRFPPQTGDTLTFWMKLRQPALLNFDELSTATDNSSLYYFTNQQDDTLALRSNLHLSSDSSGVSGADAVTRSEINYRYHHTSEVSAGEAKVMHILSGREVTADSIVNQSGQSDLLFILNDLPVGKCQLIIAGSIKDEFYNIGQPAFRPFGVIELSLADTLESNYRIVESDRSLTTSRPAYSILFRNRKTYWRYTIHLQPSSTLYLEMAALSALDKVDFLSKLNITANDTTITFTRLSATDTAVVFVSDTDLSLQEQYSSTTSVKHDPLCLSLKKYIGDMAKEAVVRSDLPYPQTALIDATALPAIYSDIFLTL
ncbi:MAG: hypothetical protein HGB23_06460 [Chlorobiaceae bacterium]|nr:hypothetical protein [Chlorobiaceae bacterium]